MRPLRLIWWVICSTLVIEGIGAVLLARHLAGDRGWWLGLFHSVSAFCNAGFTLFPDSLVAYRSDPLVNGVVGTLIVLGGIGFIAQVQLLVWLRAILARRRAPLYLHTRVVLLASLTLWVGGAVVLLLLEWGRTMSGLPLGQKVLCAAFQSVTARTAGFNTLEIGHFREPTLFFLTFLMFIGAAPGGCAGGINVTTAVVILATLRARIMGRPSVPLLGRTVPPELVQRASLIAGLAALLIVVVIGSLLFSEELPAGQARSDRMSVLAFEAVSAFGTVGLSTGLTSSLTPVGKLTIIACMFVGRLGPLFVAVAVFRRRTRASFEYPREELGIG